MISLKVVVEEASKVASEVSKVVLGLTEKWKRNGILVVEELVESRHGHRTGLLTKVCIRMWATHEFMAC